MTCSEQNYQTYLELPNIFQLFLYNFVHLLANQKIDDI